MNLNRLVTFEAVARLRSFTAAARELALSQPAVSVQIRELERHFGLSLLDRRRRRGVVLTSDGHVLYGYARRMLETAREAEQAVAGARELQSGSLALVATPTAASYALPAVLAEFKSRYPAVHMRLFVMNSQEALAYLTGLQADLGVMTGTVRDRRVRTVPFFEDELVLALPPGHRLASRRSVDVSQLAGERMIVRERGSATRELVESEFRRAGVRVEITMELASNEATLQAVASGNGCAVVSAEMVHRETEARRIVAVRMRGVALRRTFWFAFPAERAHYPTINKFIEIGQRAMRRP
jgi:DNA-binding transcriptional LysR family regulator